MRRPPPDPPPVPVPVPVPVLVLVLVAVLAPACQSPPSATDAGTSAAPPLRWIWTSACPDGSDPATPVAYGRCAVDEALAEARSAKTVALFTTGDADAAAAAALEPLLDPAPESYVVAALGGETVVLGRDPVGTLYGALEVAEGLRLEGDAALPVAAALRGRPAVAFRAANLFLVLPASGDADWWFLDEGFWRQYLDLLVHARFNFLDLHGMYDLATTVFPNALPYFASSPSLPDVGVLPAARDRNQAMLKRIVDLAAARGIRVGLMTYSASSSLDGVAPETLDDYSLQLYTREAVADLATRTPGLDRIGFRIGESGRTAAFYVGSFVAGAADAGTGVRIYTRSWLTPKDDIAALADATGGTLLVESKMNGEHWAAPYPVAGGAFAGWGSYSYQDFLTPPAPYDFVFQVRAGGTHRIFREASYQRTATAVRGLLALSPRVLGFSLEAPHAYFPQRDYYHARAADRVSPWTFARDDLMYLLWGRLAYDPTTPADTFRAVLAYEAGTDGLWAPLQAASDIVPWIQTASTCGPDHRDFAPELELGGDVGFWAGLAGGPARGHPCDAKTAFDTFAVADPAAAAADLASGDPQSRLSPVDVAARVLDDARVAAAAQPGPGGGNALGADIARECLALGDLGQYFGHKLRGATALAVHARTGAPDWLGAARSETLLAAAAWRALAGDTGYILPFADNLRMRPLGYAPFHWSMEVPALDDDGAALDAVADAVAAAPPVFAGSLPDPQVWLASPRAPGPGLADLSVSPADATAPQWTVRARFASPLPADAQVRVLWKAFESGADWMAAPADLDPDGTYAPRLGGTAGALFAVEVITAAGAWRYPDPMTGVPYISLAP